jgi:tetratricopeptide (TPR) repeat protein
MSCKKVFLVCCAALLIGCQSMQKDLMINSPQSALELNLVELEKMIVALDGIDTGARQTGLAAARSFIGDLENEAAADTDYAGRLAAWSGRLAILEGRYSEALRLQRSSQSLSPGNIPSTVLSLRLEGDPARRLELIDKELELIGQGASFASGQGELQIEKGRTLLDLRRYSAAAGAFDTAFAAGLDPIYREAYSAQRNRAWELRNTEATERALDILERGGMTWKDCIALTKNETQLLRFLSAGRDLPETELFDRLLERSFIPYTQDITRYEWPRARPRIEDAVLRSGAAWYIWRLYAEARADRGLLSRYSARYSGGGTPRSPIADLPPLSPFFDSILGCVENEYLSLPDGRNFKPDDPVRGAELLAILKRIQ